MGQHETFTHISVLPPLPCDSLYDQYADWKVHILWHPCLCMCKCLKAWTVIAIEPFHMQNHLFIFLPLWVSRCVNIFLWLVVLCPYITATTDSGSWRSLFTIRCGWRTVSLPTSVCTEFAALFHTLKVTSLVVLFTGLYFLWYQFLSLCGKCLHYEELFIVFYLWMWLRVWMISEFIHHVHQ